MKKQGFHALIVAAGLGTRLGHGKPKAYVDLAGYPLITRTIMPFAALEACLTITVIIHPDHESLAQASLQNFERINFVYGGDTRQESVKRGLESLSQLNDDDLILVHDAARPFIQSFDILKVYLAAQKNGAASLALPIVDTLRYAENDIAGAVQTRKNLFAMQTPQAFHKSILQHGHNQTIMATDCSELVTQAGFDVTMVQGSRSNFKITTDDDLKMATQILAMNKKIKTGIGYDVHAFDVVPATSIRLGGIDIPFEKKLAGHSDADVVLHAITDALYGAISDGDIGFHFPPSDQAHKNKDSAIFLKHAVARAAMVSACITHIDCVIICEEPKITPHREAMRARIAEICGLELCDVAVKATTSEGLGFTGRKEGIAAQALVTIEITK